MAIIFSLSTCSSCSPSQHQYEPMNTHHCYQLRFDLVADRDVFHNRSTAWVDHRPAKYSLMLLDDG